MRDIPRDIRAPEVLLTTLTVRGLLHSLVWAELYDLEMRPICARLRPTDRAA